MRDSRSCSRIQSICYRKSCSIPPPADSDAMQWRNESTGCLYYLVPSVLPHRTRRIRQQRQQCMSCCARIQSLVIANLVLCVARCACCRAAAAVAAGAPKNKPSLSVCEHPTAGGREGVVPPESRKCPLYLQLPGQGRVVTVATRGSTHHQSGTLRVRIGTRGSPG